jgi:hypothetical protein
LANVAHQHTFPCKISKFKVHNVLDIKPIFLKLWIFTNFKTVFPVVVSVFDFDEFSEGLLHGHWLVKQRTKTSQSDVLY